MRAEPLEDQRPLGKCRGLNLDSPDAATCLLATSEGRYLLKCWIETGCVSCNGSWLDTVTAENTLEGILVRDSSCLEELCLRGFGACKKCFAAANRTKFYNSLREWVLRIKYVDMAHITLEGNAEAQSRLAAEILEVWPETEIECLKTISYPAMVAKCRLVWLRIPVSRMNAAMQTFVNRSLRYLTPTMLAGVNQDVKHQVTSYIDALSRGDLDKQESKAIATWKYLELLGWVDKLDLCVCHGSSIIQYPWDN